MKTTNPCLHLIFITISVEMSDHKNQPGTDKIDPVASDCEEAAQQIVALLEEERLKGETDSSSSASRPKGTPNKTKFIFYCLLPFQFLDFTLFQTRSDGNLQLFMIKPF